jgi:hypothetical protein
MVAVIDNADKVFSMGIFLNEKGGRRQMEGGRKCGVRFTRRGLRGDEHSRIAFTNFI